MKKEGLLIIALFFVLALGGCANLLDRITQQKEIPKEIEEKGELIGPGGCMGEECEKYCEENEEECQKWCKQNQELCKKMLDTAGHEAFPSDFSRFEINPEECQQNPQKCLEFCEKNPGVCPEEHVQNLRSGMKGFVGPGGCKGLECQQYCQQNIQECQGWCLENPTSLMCSFILGGGLPFGLPGSMEKMIGGIADPPSTTILFAKSLNFNAGQFTQEDILKAKQLGANMVTFWPIRMVRNDEFSIFTLADLPLMIDFAHKNGLQVELRSSIIIPELAKNYERYKANALKHAAEYAKLAERYRVYRIIPFAEVDNDLMNHCNRITEFSQAVLAEMKKYYSGKIGTGVVAPWRDCGFTFKGYDYVSVSAYPHNDLATSINWARRVAERSGIRVLHVGEIGVLNQEDHPTPDMFQTTILNKAGEADFYQDFFTKFSDKIDGISIFYNSGTVTMGINGDPAEQVVKEEYNKIMNSEEKSQEITKLIVANPIDLSQVVRISKFRSCAGHDYSGLNINLEREPISSMKHYIIANEQLIGAKDTVKVFAPFDGKVTEIRESDGKQIFISANKDPRWNFVFFHISPLPNIQVGASVKAGQLIGQGYMREWPGFDIAFKRFSFKREIFDSLFMHMQDSVLKEYELRGVTVNNIIIPKEFRETHPCPIRGIIDGEEAFTGETEKEDSVVLK